MTGWQAVPEERCGNCKYFHVHYVQMFEEYYVPLRYGHCSHPRLKKRRAEEHCPHWCAGDTETPRSL